MKRKLGKFAKSTSKYDSQRETRVLLEEMNKGIKIVAEQHGNVITRLDKMDERLQKNDAVRFKLEWGIEALQNRVGTLDTKVDRIENELKSVTMKSDNIENELKSVKTKGDNIENELKSVKTKGDNIENELKGVKMAVIQNSKDIKENSTKIDRIEKKLDTVTSLHEQRIQKLETVRH